MTEILTTPVGKTKNAIWEAYKELRDQLAASQEGQATTTTAVAKKKAAKAAVRAASSLDITNLSQGVTDLMANIDRAKTTYEQLQAAIDAKQAELKEVHGIEAEANALVALIATKDRLVAEREERAASIIDEAKANARETEEQSRTADRLQTQDRERREAEWEYEFNREKKRREDELQDKLNDLLKQIEEREMAVKAREDKATEIENEKGALEALLETERKNRQAAIDEAVLEAKEKANRSAGISKSMEANKFQAAMTVKDAAIDTLKQRTAELTQQLEAQQHLVQDANTKLADMARASLRAGADAATVAEITKVAAGAGKK